ncbi:SDR family oxidoreductase [Streptomyces sp. NPDC127051]|uniref:SDR family oxidoreductase n=1 Tax=Streptomyces sp. NPDC127051 TaxID=3347119 RepID=UPI0036553DCA
MAHVGEVPDLVIGVSPMGEPDARLVTAVSQAGGLGVLDLGAGDRKAREALEWVRRWSPGPFGVRVGGRCQITPSDLGLPADGGPHTVVLGTDSSWRVSDAVHNYRTLVEVTSLEEALDASRVGAHGLIARGCESGGKVGELSTFVLLQQLRSAAEVTLPVWACGGIGPRTAAAAVVGGAEGVVLDTQLALLAESGLSEGAAAALRALDGSETTVVDGRRVLLRPGADMAVPQPPDAQLAGGGSGSRVLSRPGGTASLPLGQDSFLAARFAAWWGNAGRAVRAMREAMEHPVRVSVSQTALGSEAPMSRTLGTRLPIAQGPMTRVSDQAGFASAVAGEGALPFVALALAREEQGRTILESVDAALAGRAWGVGLLGFAPEEIRQAQTEAVLGIRPSHVIIAGGRPSQARVFEEAGIAAFLHVPSPGLLSQFLDAGARRFVFEGSECGGHVGPRYSFPLWEAQISVLEDYLDASDDDGLASRIEVFFAGGIHDECSSAMVAALSAPLAARGVALGVLMGTAYLFTEEAVTSGALQRTFQRKVVAAQSTVLLETAPGHATRCVPSHFSHSYETAKAELAAKGIRGRQLWEDLERLNAGRLRIASKGLQRQGEELVEVNAGRQLAEGLYMAGDVAILRSAPTTIAALHQAVTSSAVSFFTSQVTALGERLGVRPGKESARGQEAPMPLDIAVVGMACMFPKAPDLAAFWANTVHGVDAIEEIPAERWDSNLHYRDGGTAAKTGMSASKWGGFLPRIEFDALGYGIPPASLPSIEPVQLLALEAARRALDDAGYGESARAFDRSRTAVVFGAEAGSDQASATLLGTMLRSAYGEIPEELADQLPTLTEDSFPGMLANVISGRIANRLDLGGANYTVDAACASSLAAVDVACKELTSGTSDLVLCGGADLHNGINDYVLFSSVHALSPTGRSRAFDSAADGIALGEGVACLVLKRLADAERDGDRVYSVIKGIGASSDGRSLGLTAPRPQGQRAALQRAYLNAGVSPAAVGLLEAHGTGTVVGDRTELSTLTGVFTEAGAATGSCTLGSVKSQIGHTKCAAGLAGLIKASMSLYTGVKPPTLHLRQPNLAWQADSSPFVFHTEATPWAAPPAERIAGISAFGFGGTNFHTVLAAHDKAPPPLHGLHQWPAELFIFRGTTQASAHQAIKDVLALHSEAKSGTQLWRLRDLAQAASHLAETSRGPVWLAVVSTDLTSLGEQLRRALAGEHDPAAGIHVRSAPAPQRDDEDSPAWKTALLFPGQGSQRPGMFAQQFIAFPELQGLLQSARVYADVLYPPAGFDTTTREAQRASVTDTRIAQPALGIAGLAAHAVLTQAGVTADMTAGHSYGELTALCAAGVISPRSLLKLSAQRAESIMNAIGDDPGSMAAVSASRHQVEKTLREAIAGGRVVIANHNAPEQSVISGPGEEVDSAVDVLRSAGHSARRLPVACAFHSPVVEGATTSFAHALRSHSLRTPEIPVFSTRTAAPYPTEPDAIATELSAQISAPVRFTEQIEAMYAAGARVFVEAGPGSVLTQLVGAILGDRPHCAVACEPRSDAGLSGFLTALAQLAVAGVPVRTSWMFRGRDARDAGHGTASRRGGWTVDGQGVRTADGELLTPSVRPVIRKEHPVPDTRHSDHPSDREALIHAYLRASREMVAAHREVFLSYLGAPAAPSAELAPAAAAPIAGEYRPVRLPSPEPPAAAQHVSAAQEAHEVLPAAPDEAGMLRTVTEIISARTGYPLDLIEPDLDLEADLSIDSIKRAEIAGELASRLALPAGAGAASLSDEELEELAGAHSATSIVGWVMARLVASAHATSPAPSPASSAAVPSLVPPPRLPHTAARTETAPVAASAPPRRFRVVRAALPDASMPEERCTALAGKRFVILGDGDRIALAAAAALTRLGAETQMRPGSHLLSEQDGPIDGVLYLQPLGQAVAPLLPQAFSVIKCALARTPHWLLAARCGDDSAPRDTRALGTAGLRGLFRTISKEHPEMVSKVVEVEVDPATAQAPAAIAEALVSELFTHEPAVVLRGSTGRYGLELRESPLSSLSTSGAGPDGTGAPEAAAIGLTSESVILLTGGARGITAQCAAALAAASRCRIELIGRTPLPRTPEDPATSAAHDRLALRAALAAQGAHRTAADIDQAAARILAQREILATLDRLRMLGSPARYRCVDVCDDTAVSKAVNDVYAHYGRLDGIVHAAGVIEDRLMADKTPESFQRVFATKVGGAAAVLKTAGGLPVPPRFVVCFGSISAVVGNRGQGDYAAANDAQEELAAEWAAATGRRALTVHWGPWAPGGDHTGMVTPELASEYARRGIQLIDPEEGTLSLLRELAWGDPSHTAVVYTASGW